MPPFRKAISCNADPLLQNMVIITANRREAARESTMKISAKRMAVLREHVRAESEHDMDASLAGMTSDCFNDVAGVPKSFVGPEQTAQRHRKHWEGFPDFTVRVRRVLCADESCVVTENECHCPCEVRGRQHETACW